MSSLISSVSAFAFAAAKVGVEEDLSSDSTDFQSIINKFDLFMRLFSRSGPENSGLVDYASVAKGGRLIDNRKFALLQEVTYQSNYHTISPTRI